MFIPMSTMIIIRIVYPYYNKKTSFNDTNDNNNSNNKKQMYKNKTSFFINCIFFSFQRYWCGRHLKGKLNFFILFIFQCKLHSHPRVTQSIYRNQFQLYTLSRNKIQYVSLVNCTSRNNLKNKFIIMHRKSSESFFAII